MLPRGKRGRGGVFFLKKRSVPDRGKTPSDRREDKKEGLLSLIGGEGTSPNPCVKKDTLNAL